MKLSVTLVTVVVALIGVSCGSASDEGMDGLWILVSAEVDGTVVAADLYLEIEGSTISGETICDQTFGGEFGGPFEGTAEGCDAERGADLEAHDERFMAAIAGSPSREADELVFTADGVRLTYERTADVSAEDLFAALDDPALAADPGEIFVDPEAGHQRGFVTLSRLEHASSGGSFFVGTTDGLVCLVISSDSASLTSCQQPRKLALRTEVLELADRSGSTGLRVAFVPDAFVDSTELSAIGVLNGNVLVMGPDIEQGNHVLTNALGEQYVITVGG